MPFTMPRSDGFILPLVLILMFIMSLILVTLYQIEAAHLSIFSAIISESRNAAKESENQNKILKHVQLLNAAHSTHAHVPTQNNQIYLRAVDKKTGSSVWQSQTDAGLLTIQCVANHPCEISAFARY